MTDQRALGSFEVLLFFIYSFGVLLAGWCGRGVVGGGWGLGVVAA